MEKLGALRGGPPKLALLVVDPLKEILKGLDHGIRLPEGYVVDPEEPFRVRLGHLFEHGHLSIVNESINWSLGSHVWPVCSVGILFKIGGAGKRFFLFILNRI